MRRLALLAACASSPPMLANRGAPHCDLPIDLAGDADYEGQPWKAELTLDATGSGLLTLGGEVAKHHISEMVFTLSVQCDDGRIHGTGEVITLEIDPRHGAGVAASAGKRWTLHGLQRK